MDSLAARLTASLDNKPENSGAVSQSATSLAGFWALIAVQFQNAFSDNALKWLVSFLVLETALTKQERDLWFVLVVPLLFAVPFLLFSIPGGYLADRYSKRTVAIGTKFFRTYRDGPGNVRLIRQSLRSRRSSALPRLHPRRNLRPHKVRTAPRTPSRIKTQLGKRHHRANHAPLRHIRRASGRLLGHPFSRPTGWSGVVFLTLTIIGLLISLRITRVPAADPTRRFDWNFPREFFVETHRLWRDNVLRVAVLANTFFWFLGSLLLLNIVLYATDILHVDDQHSSYLLAALSFGIGIGSFLAGYASAGKIEHGMILPGMIGIMAMSALLASPGLSFVTVAILLALLRHCGGFFVVPVNALIQHLPPPEEKGRTIAVANLLSFVGVALQPLAQYGMLRQGHPDPSRVFLFAAAMTLVMGIVLIAHDAAILALAPSTGRISAQALPYRSPFEQGLHPPQRRAVQSRLCMSTVATLPGAPSAHRGLSYWMERVLKELEHVRKDPAADPVHDLRVAIRRCRSVAAVFQEVDPDPAWRQMRRVPRKLFRRLGALRDSQVMDEWVKQLAASDDPLRAKLQAAFAANEPDLRQRALRAVEKFDGKSWSRLERKLRKRARLVPCSSLAAQCLAVERFEEAKELHTRAQRTDKPETVARTPYRP